MGEPHEPLNLAAATEQQSQHSCLGFIKNSEQLPALEAGRSVIELDVDPSRATNGFAELSQKDNGVCAGYSDVMEAVSDDKGIGLVGEDENVVGLIAVRLLEDESGVGGECLDDGQGRSDDCIREADRFWEEKVGLRGENGVDCEGFLELLVVPDSQKNCSQLDDRMDGKNVDVQSAMEEDSDGIATVETDTSDEIVPPSTCETSVELNSENDMPRNCNQQDGQNEDESGNVKGVTEDDCLDAIETVKSNKIVLSLGCKMPALLVQAKDWCRNGSQQGDQRDDKNVSVQGVMEENNCDLAPIEVDTHDIIMLLSGREMPAELIPVKSLHGDGREQYNHDCGASQEVVVEEKIINFTALGKSNVQGVMEQKSNGIVVTETVDTCENILPSLGYEMPAECWLTNGIEQDMQDSGTSIMVSMEEKNNDLAGIESASIQGVMEDKTDGLAAIETATFNEIDPSPSCEMPARIISANVSPRNGVELDKQDDGTSLTMVSEEKSVLLTRLKTGNQDQKLPPMDHEILLEFTPVTCPPSKCLQQDDQKGDQIISCPFAGGVMEETGFVLDVTETTTSNYLLPSQDKTLKLMPMIGLLDENVHHDEQQVIPCKMDSKAVNGLALDWAPEQESNASARTEADICSQASAHGTIDSSSAVDCSGETDYEAKNNVSIDSVSETKCHDIESSSSRRSNGAHKSSWKNQTKRAARKCRNTTKVPNLHRDTEIVFKSVTRRRSCFSKPPRTCAWGLLGNITQNFTLINGLKLDEIENLGSQKARGGQGSGKRNKLAGGTSRRSSKKGHVSAHCIRLKVKVGKEVCQTENNPKMIIPEVINTKASGDLVSEYRAESCQETRIATEKRYADAGTSPDSEVINSVPEVQVDARCQEDFPDAVLSPSKAFAAAEEGTGGKKGEKKENLPQAGNFSRAATSLKKVKLAKKRGGRQRKGDSRSSSEILTSCISANDSVNVTSTEEYLAEPVLSPGKTELGVSGGALRGEIIMESKIFGELDADLRSSESQISKNPLPSTKSRGCRLPRKSDGVNKRRSKVSDSAKSRRANGCKERGIDRKSVKKNKAEVKSVCDVVYKGEEQPEIGQEAFCSDMNCCCNHNVDDNGKIDAGNDTAAEEVANLDMPSSGVMEQNLFPDNAWVRCDDCLKWRRISVRLVESISHTHRQWICEDNMDKAFADCSIPQEKSNAEINAELGISDADEDACDTPSNYMELECGPTSVSKEYEFTCITTNQFLHRARKTQTIDEVCSQHANFASGSALPGVFSSLGLVGIMVCYCKAQAGGKLGCGDECLNRMLNIECVQGTCPCGDLCSNQQFQKRNYAKMAWDRCGKKGFGLRLEEDISRGQFLIEYVGEVLDAHAYEARQKEYASKGHKHFYFMTLDGSELVNALVKVLVVIDACVKGNLGRFINHSCDPNCRTEKWVVNGEICIGLFALRDIKKGEEVTFDYNYVRVVGAAAKRCYCGSPQCQGYIGGDPTSTEVTDQVDSDEEFPEPVMLEDGEVGDGLKNKISKTSFFDLSKGSEMESKTEAGNLEVATEIKDLMNQSTPAISQSPSESEMNGLPGDFSSPSKQVEISPQTEDMMTQPTPAVQQETSMEDTMKKSLYSSQKLKTSLTSVLTKPSPDEIMINRKSKSATAENKRVFVKSRFIIKTPPQSGLIKKGKSSSNFIDINKVQTITNKPHMPLTKPKKLSESTSDGHFEAVQEKLNELLDSEGGISKRKDAPKGYLKLLLLTAASGAIRNGEAIQSNRELSMILDALLKTRSRMVLMDIIEKNGLRMLHNIMKQYRRDFKKIPILRKLLKVLEYLAIREILTLEHISGGPPCPGMESFRESMLSLTEHNDKQVHQIARSFRDRWIPRHIRKLGYMDRHDGRMEIQRGSNCNRVLASQSHWHDQGARHLEALNGTVESSVASSVSTAVHEDCSVNHVGSGIPSVATSVSTAVHEDCSVNHVGSGTDCSVNHVGRGTRTRKRKSRWDQPAEENVACRSLQHVEQNESGLLQQSESNSLPELSKEVPDHVDNAGGEYSYCPHCVHNYCWQDEASGADNGRQNIHEDVPPGFSSPFDPALVSNASSTADNLPHQNVFHSKFPVGVIVGLPQRKFNSRLPVSYGIPLAVVQQLGSPLDETVESWVIAPGMPFHPFPPLPPLPSCKKGTLPSALNSMENDDTADRGKQGCNDRTTSLDENSPSMTGANQPDVNSPGPKDHQTFKRARGSSSDLGRRYFRQQKWNKMLPPWIRSRNGWGCIGDNSRGGMCSTDLGSLTNEQRNSYY
ncbi:hypothetical protein SADUNF_Sadunf02G0066600 [Salix dunnii]|uniref:Histone-lysine N-methyltransferase ASHH2 n=1 Tax=Salix dunnii TaxID=1413687 RepID=A0A835N6H0_9ROSI|nr:hypothetical protein SADUNF_Sadunf02G0066600 [Salix dunnii]